MHIPQLHKTNETGNIPVDTFLRYNRNFFTIKLEEFQNQECVISKGVLKYWVTHERPYVIRVPHDSSPVFWLPAY